MNNKNPKSLSAKELNEWLTSDSKIPLLIDVREKEEISIAPFPFKVMHLPLSTAPSWIETLQQTLSASNPVVVICHGGVRSWHFCNWLLEKTLIKEVWNLDGGIDAWSREVDPNIPRY